MRGSRWSPGAVLRSARQRAEETLAATLGRAAAQARLTMRVDGTRVRVSPSAMARALWKDRHVYDRDLTFYRRFLRPGDAVVDVGANIGLATLVAAKVVGPSGRIVAVEPHPRTFEYLRDNVQLNGLTDVVQLYCVALGEREGQRRIVEFPGDDSQNSLGGSDHGGIRVAVVPLDSLLTSPGPTALLKLDVEGYEKFVLDGANRTLATTGCVYFESWERHFARYGYAGRDLLDGLRARGFRVYRSNGTVVEALPDDHCSAECENLLAVRDLTDFLGRTRYRLGRDG
jgi:FkbM family methyltransferase